jgi:hypothetical protein
LLNDNAPAHKAARVCQFLTQEIVTTLYHTSYSPNLYPSDYFLFPKLKMKLKGTPLCGCCWDPRSRNWWIKEGPKRGIFGNFSETARLRKSLYICQGSLFWIKNYVSSSCVFDFLKISPKTFRKQCVRSFVCSYSWRHKLLPPMSVFQKYVRRYFAKVRLEVLCTQRNTNPEETPIMTIMRFESMIPLYRSIPHDHCTTLLNNLCIIRQSKKLRTEFIKPPILFYWLQSYMLCVI